MKVAKKGITPAVVWNKDQLDEEIKHMGKDTVVHNLKDMGLPVFGTAIEKRNRLWKHFGLNDENSDPSKKVNIIQELNQLE